MNEQSILCFLSTSETHSFSTTAREMMISQQAVSRYIQKLEEELGITLFIRDQNFVTLTMAGRHFYRYLQEFSSQFYELQTDIRENRLDAAIICNSQVYGNAETAIEDFAAEDLYLFFPESSGAPDPTSQILFDASFGDWSKQQWNAVSEKLSHRHVDADIRHTAHMPNLISALINVENAAGMAVCDVNFGYMASVRTEYATMPIQMKSSLALIWNKQNENPLIPEFLTYAKTLYDPENHVH